MNDPRASLVCMEWGKGRILAKALAVRDLDIAQLPEPDLNRIHSLRQQVRQLKSELRAEDIGLGKHAAAGQALAEARRGLEAAIAHARESTPGFQRSRLTADELFEAVPRPGAIVMPLVTDEGSVVYLLLKDQAGRLEIVHLSLPWLTRSAVAHFLVGTAEEPRWLRQYRAWRAGEGTASAWRTATRSTLEFVWNSLMGPVAGALDTRLERGASVTIIPPGEFSLFPFHVASEDGTGRGSLLDRFAVAYCPSVYSLRASQRRVSRLASAAPNFVAVVNPTGDLPYAHAETAPLEELLPNESRRIYPGEHATLGNLCGAAGTATHLHFACHGIYDSDDIMRSGLVLADATLTMGEILGPRVELGSTRLVTLSACETGLIDVNYSPEEFIGLPAAFLEGGACGVVSTLWPVLDRATALLMDRFYESHLEEKLPPASALRRAQLWLRDATRDEIARYYQNRKSRTADTEAAYLDMILGGPPEERPYEDPYYWSAFQFTGA